MALRPLRLGEMLIEAGLIDSFQLNSGLSHQRNMGGRLGASLIKLGYINEERLLSFLADQLNCARIDFKYRKILPELLQLIPAEKARQYNVVPIERKDVSGMVGLLVAMSDPTNLTVIDSLQFLTGCRIRPAIASEADIHVAIEKFYGPDPDVEENLSEVEPLEDSGYPDGVHYSPQKGGVSVEEKHQALLSKLHELGILTRQEYEDLK
jgi:MshEN domain